MKTILTFLISIVLIGNCSAFTQEELKEAKSVLIQIEQKIRTMKSCVNIAINERVGIVNINAEQKTDLIELYQNSKTELQTLYQELP